MTRSRWIVAFASLFLTWTVLVAWFAARWGGAYAHGELPEPVHETPGGLEALSRSDVTLVAVERADLGSSVGLREPEYSTACSIGGNRKVHVKHKSLANGGLQVTLDDFDGFYGETTTIELLHGEGTEVLARVMVDGFGDSGPTEWTWKRPGGWVFVSRRDWSSLSDQQPLFVRFHLYDGDEPLRHCARGFVRLPE